jgi:Xaa-Pro dipeptidase
MTAHPLVTSSFMNIPAPARGFPVDEFAERTTALQEALYSADIDAALFTMEAEVRYYSGFHSQFWESPTRPWFLLVPVRGKPIAVIPSIGRAGMAGTWIEDIRTWSSPDYDDDGIALLTQALREVSKGNRRVGVQLGHESYLRMPAANFAKLGKAASVEFVDITAAVRALRSVKSALEIEKIRFVCDRASDAFESLPDWARSGQSEREICRALKIDLLNRGTDGTPYMVAGSGQGSYDNIIMGPTDRVLSQGDVLIIDTGTIYDGYFCDFDRNYAFGQPSDDARRAYDTVFEATDAGFDAARPGTTAAELWRTMQNVLDAGGALGNSTGRSGHFLGMQLTEGPSLIPADNTVLEPGMVLTLEPGMEFAPGQLMVHEENIVVTEDAPVYLSRRAWPEMPIIDA